MNGVRRRSVLIGMVLVGILGLTAFAYYNTFGYWSRLRSAVKSFDVPPGLKVVSQREEGTAFCIITCSRTEAAIVVEYEAAQLGIDEMCDRVGSTARKHFRTVTVTRPHSDLPSGLIGCVYAQMPGVGRGAYLQATGSCFRRDNCISVKFSSGIE